MHLLRKRFAGGSTGGNGSDGAALEKAAERASPGNAAQALNRAGDRWVGEGDVARGLQCYGRAIDAHLETARYNAAAGVCRKILRVAPDAVRTRCTLAWLALGRGEVTETQREIGEYAAAAERAGQRVLATAHLRMMAEATRVPEIRAYVADALDALGASAAAAAIRRTEPASVPPRPTSSEQADLWLAVVAAATRGPADLDAP